MAARLGGTGRLRGAGQVDDQDDKDGQPDEQANPTAHQSGCRGAATFAPGRSRQRSSATEVAGECEATTRQADIVPASVRHVEAHTAMSRPRCSWILQVGVVRRASSLGSSLPRIVARTHRNVRTSLHPKRDFDSTPPSALICIWNWGPSSWTALLVTQRPRQDSNLRHRLRRPVLYPLSYEGKCRGRRRERGTRTSGAITNCSPGACVRLPPRRPTLATGIVADG